jgi:cell division protein FtsB
MKKVKQIYSRIYHSPGLKYVVVTVSGVVLIGFVDENSVWHHMVNKQRINELQEEIDEYTTQNKNDQAQIKKLDSDPKAIKKIARERYFMKADNEDIFVLSDDENTGKSILNDDETAE